MAEIFSCGDGLWFEEGKWEFNEQVSNVFPTHARKSIPGYKTVHELVCTLSKTYSEGRDNYHILDLGCSVGELETDILSKNPKSDLSIIALDKSQSMIDKCNANKFDSRVEFLCIDMMDFMRLMESYGKKFDMVVCLYTLQFLEKGDQLKVFEYISRILKDDGILILSDKFQHQDSDVDMVKELELAKFKYSTGFSVEDVAGKRHALMGVQNRMLVSDMDCVLENGFKRMEILDVSLNFVCYVFYKK